MTPTDPATARRYAQMLVDSLGQDSPDLLDELRDEPFDTVRRWPGVSTVVYDLGSRVTKRSRCSVYGYYLENRRPPEIGIARAASHRRMNFTALHELGHHLQPDHPEVALALIELDNEWHGLEDRICDAFAAEILLPDELVAQVLADSRLGPTASQVAELFERSQASRAACCVRAAQHLHVDGWVIVADRDGRVLFAAAANHEYRLAPGTPQPETSLITMAGRTGTVQGLSPVTYPSGKTSPHFNTAAVADGDYVFAVMSLGATPWTPAPVPARYRRAGGAPTICVNPGCGHDWVSFDAPCAKCGERTCPRCDRCGCVPAVERRLCTGCYMERSSNEFPTGSDLCEQCV